jgi:hypothetical protein
MLGHKFLVHERYLIQEAGEYVVSGRHLDEIAEHVNEVVCRGVLHIEVERV